MTRIQKTVFILVALIALVVGENPQRG